MRRCWTILLFIFLNEVTFAQFQKGAAGDSTNLAMSATVTTSYVSSWETLTAVNDGYEPAGSGDSSVNVTGKMSPGIYFAVFTAREVRTVNKIIVN